DIAPMLGIESPTHRCGKTTLATCIKCLVKRALPTSNISGPAIYRTVEKYEPTLVMDEADTFLTDPTKAELRGIINSGHWREMAFVIRSAGSEQDHEPKIYRTWCAKVLALIGKLPTTNDDRTIKLKLARKPAEIRLAKLRRHNLAPFVSLHQKIVRWVADHA